MPKRLGDDLREQLRTVPQKLIRELCGGRQTIQLQRIAERWGFPLDGATVDLFAVFNRLCAFLVKYGPMLSALMEEGVEGEENTLGVQYLKAKIAKVSEDAKMARLRRELKEGTVLDQVTISMGLELMADKIRQAGEQAQRQWGSDGFDLYDTMLKGFVADIERLFEKTQDGDTQAAVDPADEAVQSGGDDPPAENDEPFC